MQIKVNEDNIITSFAFIGGIDGGIEIDDSILPDGFVNIFGKNRYKYIDGEVVFNNNIEEEETEYTLNQQDDLVKRNEIDSYSLEQLKMMVANLQKQSLQGTKLSVQIAQQNAKAMQKITELEAEIQSLKEDKGDA